MSFSKDFLSYEITSPAGDDIVELTHKTCGEFLGVVSNLDNLHARYFTHQLDGCKIVKGDS